MKFRNDVNEFIERQHLLHGSEINFQTIPYFSMSFLWVVAVLLKNSACTIS